MKTVAHRELDICHRDRCGIRAWITNDKSITSATHSKAMCTVSRNYGSSYRATMVRLEGCHSEGDGRFDF